jgi:hypothetical protein
MSLRFYRRVSLIPGVRVNFSRSGLKPAIRRHHGQRVRALATSSPNGLAGLIAQLVRLPFDRGKLLVQTGGLSQSGRGSRLLILRRKAVDLAFEVKKLTRQRAALPDTRGAQFRECALGDAGANCVDLEHRVGRRGESVRIRCFWPKSPRRGRAPSPLRAWREMLWLRSQCVPAPNEGLSRSARGSLR